MTIAPGDWIRRSLASAWLAAAALVALGCGGAPPAAPPVSREPPAKVAGPDPAAVAEEEQKRLLEAAADREARLAAAALAITEGDLAEARRLLAALVEANPDDAEAQYGLGRVAEKSGDIEGAWRGYQAALQADPELADARYDFAVLAIREGQLEEGSRQAEIFRARSLDDARADKLTELLARAKGTATVTPSPDDPLKGVWTLADAVQGLPAGKTITAAIHTDLGTLHCTLFDQKAPITVASFVGLARGTRPWKTPSGVWERRPAYDGSVFHRVIKGFMIQGGDPKKDGTGEAGFYTPDEVWPGALHDRAGLLCSANRGPNTNSAQFFVTDAAAPHLDKGHTIFGECAPLALVHKLASVRTTTGDKPTRPLGIQRVTISRR